MGKITLIAGGRSKAASNATFMQNIFQAPDQTEQVWGKLKLSEPGRENTVEEDLPGKRGK